MMNSKKIIPLAILSMYSLANNSLAEETNASKLNLSPIAVTATRVEQNTFDLPVSIDVVDAETIQEGRLQFSISESLARVPGLVAASRGQSAQDVQISSRGFGARSAFGVRGVRLYADGIPLTMPDGQGQAGTFDLSSAKSIEVMRGPFSALYGNSSGGVVQILTADGPKDTTLSGAFTFGSYGTKRESVKVGGTEGNFNYNVDFSHYESDNYRLHSAVRTDLFNAKLGFQLNEDTRLTLLITDLDQPLSQDPGGLSASQLNKPKQVALKAETFNTRVSKSQTQVGVKLDHVFDENNVMNFTIYGGIRENSQYQSSGANSSTAQGYTPGTQTIRSLTTGAGIVIRGSSGYYYGDARDTSLFGPGAATVANGNAGGVAEIKRDFWGTDLRFTHKGLFATGPYQITVGTNFDTMTDDRTGYDNFIVNTAVIPHTNIGYTYKCGTEVICGVKGLLRRDEQNSARNFDQYGQASWAPTDRLNVVAGLRHSNVTIKSTDNFLSNGNSSGSATFSKTLPVIGLLFKVNDNVNIYANAGQGFETPSLVETAYLPGGSGGFNTSIKPATSNNYEIGAKAFINPRTRATIAVFKTDTNNEIVVADSVNGRSSYQNAGGTERNGVELTIDSNLGGGFNAFASYAYLDAKYTDAFCSGSVKSTKADCEANNPTTVIPTPSPAATYGTWVNSGKSIPGTYRQTAYAELSWKNIETGFSTAIEARGVGQTYVSDKSTTDKAHGYAIFNWRGGFTQNINRWKMSEFLRIENLFERDYVGSVKVNEATSQFYEPAAGRNWLLGINASYQF